MLRRVVAAIILVNTAECVFASASGQTGNTASEAISVPQAEQSSYLLGPGDQVSVLDVDLDELNGKSFRINMAGDLNLPLVGCVHAGGLTVSQLEAEVAKRVSPYVKQPDVVIGVTEYRSQPVSVLGAVGSPGVHQLEGQKTLYEVLSLAGGLRPEAGNTVLITRSMKWGKIPLPDAKLDSSGKFSVAAISVTSILSATGPAQNVTICPNDIISISRADLVYAVGSVNRPGGFPIGQADSLSALQVISLAQGLQRTAAGEKANILRSVPNSPERVKIAVNLKQLMSGKGSDVHLQADDILFVPNSAAKSASARSIDAIVTVASGLAIYGRF